MPGHVIQSQKRDHAADSKLSSRNDIPVRKPGAKRFSFTRAELGELDNGNVSSMQNSKVNAMNNNSTSGVHEHMYSDDLDDLVMYNVKVTQFSDHNQGHIPSVQSKTPGYRPTAQNSHDHVDKSLEFIHQHPDLENNTSHTHAGHRSGGWEQTSGPRNGSARGRSLEEEASRPEVMALINKYQPYSYTIQKPTPNANERRPGGRSLDSVPRESPRVKTHKQVHPQFSDEESSYHHPHHAEITSLQSSKTLPKARARSVDSQRRHRIKFADHQRSLSRSDSDSEILPERRRKPRGMSSPQPSHTTETVRADPLGDAHHQSDVRAEDSLPPIPKRSSPPRTNSNPVKQSRPRSWQDQAKWDLPLKSLDDSSFSLIHRPASDSSDRSSRIDPQTYQCYAAGILHSAKKSDKFMKLQNHYNTLERIASIEEQTLANNARSGKHRFNLLDVRSKSLGSMAPQSRTDDILTTKYKPEKIWELKELYADLEEAQEDEEFLFDAGNLASVQWKPWDDIGLQTRETTTQQLQHMFEVGRNQNTRAALNKIYRGIAIDFKRELSFNKLCDKYKHLDEKSRKAKVAEEWANMHKRSRHSSESSSIISYGSTLPTSYIDIMEKAAAKAKERALYGYHIKENSNRYEQRIEKLKKKTKSCPDIHKESQEKDIPSVRIEKSPTQGLPHEHTHPYVSKFLKDEQRQVGRHRRSADQAENITELPNTMKSSKPKSQIGNMLRKELGEIQHSELSRDHDARAEKPMINEQNISTQYKSRLSAPAALPNRQPVLEEKSVASHASQPLQIKPGTHSHGMNKKHITEVDSPSSSQKAKSAPVRTPPWKSEIRNVMGTKLETDPSDSGEDFHGGLENTGRNLQILNKRLENFRKRDSWRKSSKPLPGTVSKALTMFQSLEEENSDIPPIVRQSNGTEKFALRRRYTDFGDYSAQRQIDVEPVESLADFAQKNQAQIKQARSEPDLNKDVQKNPEAYQEAKGKFERMSSESETGSYGPVGLPTRSPGASGHYMYEPRTRSKSESQERPKSFHGASTTDYQYAQNPAMNTSSMKGSLDVTTSPARRSKQALADSHQSSPRRHEESQMGRLPDDVVRRTALSNDQRIPSGTFDKMMRYEQMQQPAKFYDGRHQMMPDVQPDSSMGHHPERQYGLQPLHRLHGSTEHMYETDLDTSRSQPLQQAADVSQEDHGYNTSHTSTTVSESPGRVSYHGQLVEHQDRANAQRPVDQQSYREGAKMAIVSPSSYHQNERLVGERPQQEDVLQPLPEIVNDTLINPNHRSFSTSALTTDETIADPYYGDLSRWSHVNVTQGLDRYHSQEDLGKEQKWTTSNLTRYGSATMSSQETFIIKDSETDTSPTTEQPRSAGSSVTEREYRGARQLTYPQHDGPGQDYQDEYYRGDTPGDLAGHVPRTISGDLKDIQNEYGQGSALAERDWEKHQPQTPTTPIGAVQKRNMDTGDRGKSDRHSWKRQYDVPPNVDIDELKEGKKGKSAAKSLDRSWDVIRNYTPEIGPKEFYNDLEVIGNEWQRENAKQQMGSRLHHPGYQIVEPSSKYPPEYKPPPKYVHPWNDPPEDETEQKRPIPSMSQESLNRFHPPAHSTPFNSSNDLLMDDSQYPGEGVQHSQSYPTDLASVNAQNMAQPSYSHPALHPPISKSHGMHNEMDHHQGSTVPTNQSERSQSASERHDPRQRYAGMGGRSPTGSWDRRTREEEIARRKQEMHRITAEEKRKRMEMEMRSNEARRHNDFLTEYIKDKLDDKYWLKLAGIDDEEKESPSQKSPISLNRYEDPPDAPALQRPKKKMTQYKGKAKALYSFKSQNTKELSFRRNDIILLTRQIDRNWYEGEHHGRVGIFPVNYVEVLTSLDEAREAAAVREGQARARHSFTAHTNMELTFRKGDMVTLVRRIDENWYEGRVGHKQGIFPINYVDVLKEPDTPYSSYAPTPMTGSPGQLSPVSTISNGPAPTIPSAPISPRSSIDNFDFSQPFNYGQMSAASTLQRGASAQSYNSDYGMDMLRPSSALGGRSDGYDSMQHERQNLMNRPSSAVPFSDYYGRHSMRDSGFHSSDESRYQRQQPRQQDPVSRSMSNSYEARIKQSAAPRPLDDISLITEETKYPKYRALYTYRPQNADELELQEGDIVNVMEICDDDWYVGTSERTKEFGTFPGNYVRML